MEYKETFNERIEQVNNELFRMLIQLEDCKVDGIGELILDGLIFRYFGGDPKEELQAKLYFVRTVKFYNKREVACADDPILGF